MNDYLEYPYKPKKMTMLLAGGFFALCAAGLGHDAMTNDRGMIIDGVIELSRRNATIFLWVMTVLSALFVLAAAFALIDGLLSPEARILRITPQDITLPPHMFRRESTVVRFDEITRTSLTNINRQVFLTIHYGDRRKAGINRSFLPAKGDFDTIVKLIAEKTEHQGKN